MIVRKKVLDEGFQGLQVQVNVSVSGGTNESQDGFELFNVTQQKLLYRTQVALERIEFF
jgi:hypothetical protein